MIRQFFLIFLFTLSGTLAFSQTLFVSDVDDTIKLANVRDLTEAARYAFDDSSRFTGMSDLYQQIAKNNSDIKIVYLSRAPQWLMGRTHRQFLKNGQFPAGEYIPRTDDSADVHKLRRLRELMNSFKPRKVIFVGDNGEQDADVYDRIVKEYSNQGIEFHQFIRIVYGVKSSFAQEGNPLHEGQIGFVTPLEVALELEKEHLLDTASVTWMMQNVATNIVQQKINRSEGDVAFPYYMNCSGFQWSWDESLARFDVLRLLKARVVERCHINP